MRLEGYFLKRTFSRHERQEETKKRPLNPLRSFDKTAKQRNLYNCAKEDERHELCQCLRAAKRYHSSEGDYGVVERTFRVAESFAG